MDTLLLRRCETCASFQQGPSACTGTCHNLVWQPIGDAKRYVRDRELGCYGGMGHDYWRPKTIDNPGSNGSGAPGRGTAASSPAAGTITD